MDLVTRMQLPGGSIQLTGAPIRLAPGGSTSSLSFGIFTADASTAVPAAIEGTRLAGGATP